FNKIVITLPNKKPHILNPKKGRKMRGATYINSKNCSLIQLKKHHGIIRKDDIISRCHLNCFSYYSVKYYSPNSK
ncbi:MAG TPA: hypothetical protein H9767_05500, partial [Candidatus Nosocomiicoccus stercorigallinarum]|nr:hypothetical protein [Candidatus Nosocomiicoccus stercorigallinarum]